jgi:predicted DNA-binding transcriptional regulator AlpA
MFDEQSFEWVFVVPDISGPDDKRIDDLYGTAEALVESHGGLNLVAMLTTGHTAIEAARTALGQLSGCGLTAGRTYPDFVTRADIAERADKRRQTVDNWVRGDRQKDFPSPVHLVSGGVWLWRDVRDWLQRERIRDVPDDDVNYPSLDDHTVIDYQLARRGAWPPVMPTIVPAAVDLGALARLGDELHSFGVFAAHRRRVIPAMSPPTSTSTSFDRMKIGAR